MQAQDEDDTEIVHVFDREEPLTSRGHKWSGYLDSNGTNGTNSREESKAMRLANATMQGNVC